MDTNGFVTIAAILFAVVPFTSQTSRLRLKTTGLIGISIISLLILISLYLVFFEYFGQPCNYNRSGVCRALQIDSDVAADLAIIPSFSVVVTIYYLLFSKLFPQKAWKELARHIESLHFNGDTGAAVELIEAQVTHPSSPLPKLDKKTRRAIKRFQPDHKELYFPPTSNAPHLHSANHLIETFLDNKELCEYAAVVSPQTLERLIVSEAADGFKLVDPYLEALVRDNRSRLHKEVPRLHPADLSEQCDSLPTFCFFLRDASRAEKWQVWRPVGEHAIERIRMRDYPIRGKVSRLPSDEEFWTSHYGVSLRFFDVMIDQAFRQGVGYHMWLPYLRHFISELLAIRADQRRLENASDEFPEVEDLMIYHTCSMLRSMVELCRPFGNGPITSDCEKPNLQHENSHIPKSALVCWIRSLRYILDDLNVSDRVKSDRLSSYVKVFEELAKRFPSSCMAMAAKEGLVSLVGHSDNHGQYWPIYMMIDHVIRSETDPLLLS